MKQSSLKENRLGHIVQVLNVFLDTQMEFLK